MNQLVATYQQPLYRYLCRMLRNSEDAKDVLQNTWIQVYTHLSELREQSAERVWLYRIATNCAYMWIRSEKPLESIENIDPAALQAISAEPDIEPAQVILARLEHLVLHLPPAQRAVFNLRYHEDMSYDEIALITGSTVGAAKTNYSLAQHKLRRWITASAASVVLLLTLSIGWERFRPLSPSSPQPLASSQPEAVYASDDWADFAEDDLFLE